MSPYPEHEQHALTAALFANRSLQHSLLPLRHLGIPIKLFENTTETNAILMMVSDNVQRAALDMHHPNLKRRWANNMHATEFRASKGTPLRPPGRSPGRLPQRVARGKSDYQHLARAAPLSSAHLPTCNRGSQGSSIRTSTSGASSTQLDCPGCDQERECAETIEAWLDGYISGETLVGDDGSVTAGGTPPGDASSGLSGG